MDFFMPAERVLYDRSYYFSDEAVDDYNEYIADRDGVNVDVVSSLDFFMNEVCKEIDYAIDNDLFDEISCFDRMLRDLKCGDDPEHPTEISVVAKGTVERWDRPSRGLVVADSLLSLVQGTGSADALKDCQIDRIIDTNGELHIEASHHDGSAYLDVRLISGISYDAKGFKLGGEYYAPGKMSTGDFHILLDNIYDSPDVGPCSLPRFAQRAYGSAQESYRFGETKFDIYQVAAFPDLPYIAKISTGEGACEDAGPELAGEIASKVDGAGLTPVIEKEIVHYEIIRSLGRNGLLQDITFQGGTSLRLCYGSQRYSEDLDFVAGDKFDSLPLDDFSRTLRCDLLRSYDTEVSVREPKVINDLDGVGMRRWTVSVNTNIARPDLPKQRIKLEIASVPAHTSTVRRVAVNYPELAGMYDDLTIRCQTLEEILADKLISFSATDTHIRHRDLWDIPWIVRAQEIDFSAVAALVAAKHDDYRCPVPLASMIAIGMQRAHVCYADGSFTGQMQRFLSPAVLDRTHDFDNHCDALNAIVEKCYGRVAASLGISDQVEHARRRLATEILSGSISAAGMPKRNLVLS